MLQIWKDPPMQEPRDVGFLKMWQCSRIKLHRNVRGAHLTHWGKRLP